MLLVFPCASSIPLLLFNSFNFFSFLSFLLYPCLLLSDSDQSIIFLQQLKHLVHSLQLSDTLQRYTDEEKD